MANTLEETIRDIICDTNIFEKGYSSEYDDIASTVVNQIRKNYPAFDAKTDEYIRGRLSKILSVNSNHADNKYRNMYPHTRDISKVDMGSGNYKYTFGA